jgi:glycosyltransferase involved in cell wall biosynthesis
MKKIAVVDLLFNWPPDGGARLDVREVLLRLARFAEVKLFVPDFRKFFSRGSIEGNLPFPVESLKFSEREFNIKGLSAAIKERVDNFKPDTVFITDGYFLKPYILNALREYRPVLRYYAYEPICILKSGKYFRRGRVCNGHFLEKSFPCLMCAFSFFGWRPGVFAYEFYKARAFLPKYRHLVEKGIRSASSIIVYNRIIKDRLAGYNNQITVVPSGVDTAKFFPPEQENDANIILMAGRISDPLKGFSTLRRAVEIIRNKGKDVSIMVTGDHKFKEKHIISTGWLTLDKLPALYQKAAICVVPSRWPEPFGIVAVEAMACGRPVIASNTGGLKGIIDGGMDGVLFQPGNADELARKIEYLLDNKNLRKRIGERAREKASTVYDWDKIFEKYYMRAFEL